MTPDLLSESAQWSTVLLVIYTIR